MTFAGRTKKVYNARPLLEKAIYSQLKNLAFFLCAKTEYGTVIWNDDIDIAPDHLYEFSQPVGVFSVSESCSVIIDSLIEQRHNKGMTQKELAKELTVVHCLSTVSA